MQINNGIKGAYFNFSPSMRLMKSSAKLLCNNRVKKCFSFGLQPGAPAHHHVSQAANIAYIVMFLKSWYAIIMANWQAFCSVLQNQLPWQINKHHPVAVARTVQKLPRGRTMKWRMKARKRVLQQRPLKRR